MKLKVFAAALLCMACATGAQARDVVIAVIDTGVARTVENAPFIQAEIDMVSPDAPRPTYRPDHEHGTTVASIIVRYAKVPVRIISFRVDRPGSCMDRRPCVVDPAAVTRAIMRAHTMGVDIINMSLDVPSDPLRLSAIHSAAASGIRFSIAAGNTGGEPRSAALAIAAGENGWVVCASGQGRGGHLEMSARPARSKPGYQYIWRNGDAIKVQFPNGTWGLRSGTSMAAPIWSAELASKVSAVQMLNTKDS